MNDVLRSQPSVLDYGWVDPKTLEIKGSSISEAEHQSVRDREYIDRILMTLINIVLIQSKELL